MFVTAMVVANPLVIELCHGRRDGHRLGGLWALAALVSGVVSLLVVPFVIYRLHQSEVVRTREAPLEARRNWPRSHPHSPPHSWTSWPRPQSTVSP